MPSKLVSYLFSYFDVQTTFVKYVFVTFLRFIVFAAITCLCLDVCSLPIRGITFSDYYSQWCNIFWHILMNSPYFKSTSSDIISGESEYSMNSTVNTTDWDINNTTFIPSNDTNTISQMSDEDVVETLDSVAIFSEMLLKSVNLGVCNLIWMNVYLGCIYTLRLQMKSPSYMFLFKSATDIKFWFSYDSYKEPLHLVMIKFTRTILHWMISIVLFVGLPSLFISKFLGSGIQLDLPLITSLSIRHIAPQDYIVLLVSIPALFFWDDVLRACVIKTFDNLAKLLDLQFYFLRRFTLNDVINDMIIQNKLDIWHVDNIVAIDEIVNNPNNIRAPPLRMANQPLQQAQQQAQHVQVQAHAPHVPQVPPEQNVHFADGINRADGGVGVDDERQADAVAAGGELLNELLNAGDDTLLPIPIVLNVVFDKKGKLQRLYVEIDRPSLRAQRDLIVQQQEQVQAQPAQQPQRPQHFNLQPQQPPQEAHPPLWQRHEFVAEQPDEVEQALEDEAEEKDNFNLIEEEEENPGDTEARDTMVGFETAPNEDTFGGILDNDDDDDDDDNVDADDTPTRSANGLSDNLWLHGELTDIQGILSDSDASHASHEAKSDNLQIEYSNDKELNIDGKDDEHVSVSDGSVDRKHNDGEEVEIEIGPDDDSNDVSVSGILSELDEKEDLIVNQDEMKVHDVEQEEQVQGQGQAQNAQNDQQGRRQNLPGMGLHDRRNLEDVDEPQREQIKEMMRNISQYEMNQIRREILYLSHYYYIYPTKIIDQNLKQRYQRKRQQRARRELQRLQQRHPELVQQVLNPLLNPQQQQQLLQPQQPPQPPPLLPQLQQEQAMNDVAGLPQMAVNVPNGEIGQLAQQQDINIGDGNGNDEVVGLDILNFGEVEQENNNVEMINVNHLAPIYIEFTRAEGIKFCIKYILFITFFVIAVNLCNMILFWQCLINGRRLWNIVFWMLDCILYTFQLNISLNEDLSELEYLLYETSNRARSHMHFSGPSPTMSNGFVEQNSIWTSSSDINATSGGYNMTGQVNINSFDTSMENNTFFDAFLGTNNNQGVSQFLAINDLHCLALSAWFFPFMYWFLVYAHRTIISLIESINTWINKFFDGIYLFLINIGNLFILSNYRQIVEYIIRGCKMIYATLYVLTRGKPSDRTHVWMMLRDIFQLSATMCKLKFKLWKMRLFRLPYIIGQRIWTGIRDINVNNAENNFRNNALFWYINYGLLLFCEAFIMCLIVGFCIQLLLWSNLLSNLANNCYYTPLFNIFEAWLEGYFVWSIAVPHIPIGWFMNEKFERDYTRYANVNLRDQRFIHVFANIYWPALKICIFHVCVPLTIINTEWIFDEFIYKYFEIEYFTDLLDVDSTMRIASDTMNAITNGGDIHQFRFEVFNNDKINEYFESNMCVSCDVLYNNEEYVKNIRYQHNRRYYFGLIVSVFMLCRFISMNQHLCVNFLKKIWTKYVEHNYVVGQKLVNYNYIQQPRKQKRKIKQSTRKTKKTKKKLKKSKKSKKSPSLLGEENDENKQSENGEKQDVH